MIAGSVACLVVAAAASTAYRAASLWFALAVVGQAATLQLIDAGPLLRYQHYPPLAAIASRHPWLLAYLIGQTLVVTLAVLKHARTWTDNRAITTWQLLAVLVLSTCTAATVSHDVRRYVAELGLAAFFQVLSLATIVLMAASLPAAALGRAGRRLTWLLGHPEDNPVPAPKRDRFGWKAGIATTVLAAVLSVASYERAPHVPDEVCYLYHARYFAEGLLTMPPPPVPAGFDTDLMTLEPTRWFSPVPPGWPAVLAVGAYLGVPWLVNPVLGGIAVALAYALLRRLYPRRVARYATLLLALSPWHVFLAMSYMTHTFTLVCALAAAVGIERARERGTALRGFLAGAAVGATSLIRPLEGLIVGVLIAAWAMGIGGRRLRFPALAGLLAGTVLVGALAFPYNRMLTGDPFKFPINDYTDRYHGKSSNAYGFGADRGMGWPIDPNPGHGPIDGIVNANLNVFGINTDLFGWACGSLIFVALFLCTTPPNRSDRLMLATGAVIVIAYFFYYFSGGPDFAARYWFPIIVPLVALTARGIVGLEGTAGARAGVAVAALVAASLVTFVPWRAMDKYYHFRGMRADVRRLAKQHGFANDLVFVRGNRHPDYASAVVLNPIDFSSRDTVYAWDRSAEVRDAVLAAFPGRRVWLVDGPSITRNGYRVAAGPVSADELTAGGASR